MSSSDASDDAEIAVICGPTGAGKSAIAMALAQGEGEGSVVIISADSRQIYRRFDIGTAKPGATERAMVAHVGIDLVEPTERFSAARWASVARQALLECHTTGMTPVVVGGTGLYMRALFDGLFQEPPLEPSRRGALSAYLDGLSVPELRRWVDVLDPPRAQLGRTQLLRAIEIALLTGTPISALHRAAATRSRWRPRYLLVDPGGELAEWNRRRIDRMLDDGWADEVRALMRDVPDDAPAWNATGYRTMRRLLCGELELPEAREAIVIETRQYAKRQRTWFRNQLDPRLVTRVDPAMSDAPAIARDWWAVRTRAA